MNRLIAMLERVARVLSQVPQTIVFTGGATISLYLDEVKSIQNSKFKIQNWLWLEGRVAPGY